MAIILNFLIIIIAVLISVAYFTLAERKIISAMQKRLGPNVVGYWGLLQPLSDGLKLLLKETIIPKRANAFLFILAPILTFLLSLIGWAIIPFDFGIFYVNLELGILYLFAVSSLGVYGVIISGWASNSKYAFLGGLRSTAQIISYEISIGLIVLSVILLSGSLNLTQIILAQRSIWYIVPLFPQFILFVISALAETNRAPFDLPEAEAELVSGYNVEYSAMGFALFFLGEYSNMLLMSSICVILFLGGWLPFFGLSFIPGYFWFAIKILFFVYIYIWVRATFPRYRYDQLMYLGWKIFLPLSLGLLLFIVGIIISINGLIN